MQTVYRVTPPVAAPITLAEARTHLRSDTSFAPDAAEDALITGLIDAAVNWLDGWTGVLGMALMPQTWEMALDAFPNLEIMVPLGPVISVASISYTDAAGAAQVLPGASYSIDVQGARVRPVDFWPVTATSMAAVKIRWVAGQGCPPAIRAAILILIGHWYGAGREPVVTGTIAQEVPLTVATLIAPFRRVGF